MKMSYFCDINIDDDNDRDDRDAELLFGFKFAKLISTRSSNKQEFISLTLLAYSTFFGLLSLRLHF
jgi:hypothetical protein